MKSERPASFLFGVRTALGVIPLSIFTDSMRGIPLCTFHFSRFPQRSFRHAELRPCVERAPEGFAVALAGQKRLVGADDFARFGGVLFEQLDAEMAQAGR